MVYLSPSSFRTSFYCCGLCSVPVFLDIDGLVCLFSCLFGKVVQICYFKLGVNDTMLLIKFHRHTRQIGCILLFKKKTCTDST